MKRWFDRKMFLWGLGAILGFAVLFAATFHSRRQTGQKVVDMVVFGDSVYTDIGNMTAIPDRLADVLDMSVYNASMGGTCAARLEKERRLDVAKGSVSLAGLTKAIRSMDFSVQQSVRIRESNTESFPEIVDGLAEIDFSQVKVIVIGKGLNDYNGGASIRNEEDPYDVYTFSGAIRSAVKDLRERNPEVRIILVTPIYAWYTAQGLNCEEIDNGGGFLEDYVNEELRLAEELNVEAVDLYHNFFEEKSLENWEQYTIDGFHPNETGREMITEKIADLFRTEEKE